VNAPLATLLLVDPSADDRQRARTFLEKERFIVREAPDGRSLLASLQSAAPSLIVLDLSLPDADWAELCRRVKRFGDIPIVVFTALDDEKTKVKALNLYAEDYVLKRVSYAELGARLRRVLRRTWLTGLPVRTAVPIDDRLSLDFVQREARTTDRVVRLTPLEARLLQLLVANAGQVLPTKLLLQRLWGDPGAPTGSLWEYVRRVRRKIGDDPARPRYILNEPGLGYRFARFAPEATLPTVETLPAIGVN
jgi:two-component system, OmpR family, KDP operon response regulator KdpE